MAEWELKRFVSLPNIVVFEIFGMLQKPKVIKIKKLTLVVQHKLYLSKLISYHNL